MTDRPKVMIVTNIEHGYNHDRLTGTCDPDVTIEDIEKQFHHFYFGGRETWVKDGRWGTVVHGCD